MKYKVLLMGFLISIVFQQASLALTPAEIFKNWSDSVVTIYAMTEEEKVFQGSGFFISTNGLLLTNFHVVDKAEIMIIELQDGDFFDVKALIAQDPTTDLALLSAIIPTGKTSKVKPVKLATNVPNPGEKVYVIGTPKGFAHSLSDGLLSSNVIQGPFGEIVQFTAPISSGSSGSPLFDEKGQVIGIVTSSHREAQNLNFAVAITTISKFLTERPKISKQEAELKKRSVSPSKKYEQALEGDPIFVSGQYVQGYKILLRNAFKSTIPGVFGIHFWFGVNRACELTCHYFNEEGVGFYAAPEGAGWAEDAGMSLLAKGDTVGIYGFPGKEEFGWYVDYSNFAGRPTIRTRPFKQSEFPMVTVKPAIYRKEGGNLLAVFFDGVEDGNLIFSILNTYLSLDFKRVEVSSNKIPGYLDISGGILNIDRVDRTTKQTTLYYEWESTPVFK